MTSSQASYNEIFPASESVDNISTKENGSNINIVRAVKAVFQETEVPNVYVPNVYETVV